MRRFVQAYTAFSAILEYGCRSYLSSSSETHVGNKFSFYSSKLVVILTNSLIGGKDSGGNVVM